MKEWSKKQKILLAVAFVVILIAAGAAAVILNRSTTEIGTKTFQIEITSERDGYSETEEYQSEEEYLGGFLRTFADCEWQESDYGIYISGFKGMREDLNNQYWWCILVDGESATMGADEIPLRDGAVYSFILMQGW